MDPPIRTVRSGGGVKVKMGRVKIVKIVYYHYVHVRTAKYPSMVRLVLTDTSGNISNKDILEQFSDLSHFSLHNDNAI